MDEFEMCQCLWIGAVEHGEAFEMSFLHTNDPSFCHENDFRTAAFFYGSKRHVGEL